MFQAVCPAGLCCERFWPAFRGKRICSGRLGVSFPPGLSYIQPDASPTSFPDGCRLSPAKPAGSRGEGRCRPRVGSVSRLRPPCDPTAQPTLRDPRETGQSRPSVTFAPVLHLRTEPGHCDFACERLIRLIVSMSYFFISPRRTSRLGKARSQLLAGMGLPGERLREGCCPAEGRAELPPGLPGPCPADACTLFPGGYRGSGFVP